MEHKPVTAEELAEIKARLLLTTQGQWRFQAGTVALPDNLFVMAGGAVVVMHSTMTLSESIERHRSKLQQRVDNLQFIAHAHQDVDRLLCDVERLNAELAEVVEASNTYIAEAAEAVTVAREGRDTADNRAMERVQAKMAALRAENAKAREDADEFAWELLGQGFSVQKDGSQWIEASGLSAIRDAGEYLLSRGLVEKHPASEGRYQFYRRIEREKS